MAVYPNHNPRNNYFAAFCAQNGLTYVEVTDLTTLSLTSRNISIQGGDTASVTQYKDRIVFNLTTQNSTEYRILGRYFALPASCTKVAIYIPYISQLGGDTTQTPGISFWANTPGTGASNNKLFLWGSSLGLYKVVADAATQLDAAAVIDNNRSILWFADKSNSVIWSNTTYPGKKARQSADTSYPADSALNQMTHIEFSLVNQTALNTSQMIISGPIYYGYA